MAHDIQTRIAVRQMAEVQGISLAKISRDTGINIKTITKWSKEDNWMTPAKMRIHLKVAGATATVNFNRHDPTAGIGNVQTNSPQQPAGQPVNPVNVGVRQVDAVDYVVGQYDAAVGKQAGSGMEMGKAGDVSAPQASSEQPKPSTSPENLNFRPKQPAISSENDDFSPNLSISSPQADKNPCLPIFADPTRNDDLINGCISRDPVVPVAGDWETVGEKERAATLAEMMPKDFDGFQQVIRDPESLAKVEAIRSAAFRENISAATLKLSQYALSLADTDPRQAILLLDKLAKLSGIGIKHFKLDEAGGESKASEQLRKASAKEEDGGGVIVVVD